MSDIAIKVEQLSKMYRLGVINNGTLFQDIQTWIALKRGKEDPNSRIGENKYAGDKDHFWALKDVNFEIKQGDRVGIIGRNGAGKSTLLKVLSRITAPTEGSVKIKGKVSSLLEVGTGFHGELTGRENIYLNGAILGMKKREIDKKMDEIIAFSEIEHHIDTPVKRYSSGMYVRLAFAVAAHLDSDILIADEVLAVGDASFQKKAIGKMSDLSTGQGRTVLFVSHNMGAVKNLCNRGCILKAGCIDFLGSISEAIIHYQKSNNSKISYQWSRNDIQNAIGNENIRILRFSVRAVGDEPISISSEIEFELLFYNNKPNINLDTTFELRTIEGVVVFHHGALVSQHYDSKQGIYNVKGILPPHLLNAGSYVFDLIFGEDQRYPLFVINDFIEFDVQNEMAGTNPNILPGVIRPAIKYTVDFKE